MNINKVLEYVASSKLDESVVGLKPGKNNMYKSYVGKTMCALYNDVYYENVKITGTVGRDKLEVFIPQLNKTVAIHPQFLDESAED